MTITMTQEFLNRPLSGKMIWLPMSLLLIGVVAVFVLLGWGMAWFGSEQLRMAAFWVSFLILINALWVVYLFFRFAQQQRIWHEEEQRQEESILHLLDEMSTLAEGDLTIRTTVSENITGAIADSVNYAVDALRELVIKIDDTSSRLTRYS